MLNNIVDNLEQCGQHNIVQCCFHQGRTDCAFFAVYDVASRNKYKISKSAINPLECNGYHCSHDIHKFIIDNAGTVAVWLPR